MTYSTGETEGPLHPMPLLYPDMSVVDFRRYRYASKTLEVPPGRRILRKCQIGPLHGPDCLETDCLYSSPVPQRHDRETLIIEQANVNPFSDRYADMTQDERHLFRSQALSGDGITLIMVSGPLSGRFIVPLDAEWRQINSAAVSMTDPAALLERTGSIVDFDDGSALFEIDLLPAAAGAEAAHAVA